MSYLASYLQGKDPEKLHRAALTYLAALDEISTVAPDIAEQIIRELHDQRTHLKLIASENYCSYAVQFAMGNLLTDKYSEGYPFHRFYAGCENIDQIESTAVAEAKKIFGAEHAYVQPHSGADANLVAFWAILTQKIQTPEVEKLGAKNVNDLSDADHERIRQLLVNQKIMGLSLNSGGHLTHGYRHNLSSKIMQAVSYEVDPKTGLLDYSQIRQQVKKERPAILLAGYSAYPRKINFAKMREIAEEVGAVFMVDMAHFAGLVAGGVFQGEFNPIPFAHIVTSTTHKTLRGPRGGLILCTEEFKESVDKGCPLALGGPLPHVMAAKAIAFREVATPAFGAYAAQIVSNAQALAERFMHNGLKVLTGGTDNHLVLLDISPLGLTGRQGETLLRQGRMTLNRNTIPNDKNGPWYTSGLRFGTAAVTTLGMEEEQMVTIADGVTRILKAAKSDKTESGAISKAKASVDPAVLEQIGADVLHLLDHFPLYPELPRIKSSNLLERAGSPQL